MSEETPIPWSRDVLQADPNNTSVVERRYATDIKINDDLTESKNSCHHLDFLSPE